MSQSLSELLEESVSRVQAYLGNPPDLRVHRFRAGGGRGTAATLLYIDGLVDAQKITSGILTPAGAEPASQAGLPATLESLQERLLTTASVEALDQLSKLATALLDGKTVLLLDGQTTALAAATTGYKSRSPDEPITEGAVRGPREGFTEDLTTNISLLRRRLRTPRLRLERLVIGRLSQTSVMIAYIAGVAREGIVDEVRARLKRIDIDHVTESAFLEEMIEDQPISLFPQVEHTERPDKTTSAITEGRVAILTDNTPFVLLAPAVFGQFLQAAEDYYERFWYGTAIRWIRLLALLFALALPGLYVAVATMHQEMLPTALAMSVAAARQGVPFPTVVEALLMEVVFEVLREAGIRLPRPVGQAVSVVGGIVVGQAAVQAGVVSASAVIIVAVTGISSFALPAYGMAIALRLLRFPLILLGASMGLPGLTVGVLLIILHLAGLRSFGVPFLSPASPLHGRGLLDVLFRIPQWADDNRPAEFTNNLRRVGHRQRPRPPQPEKTGGQTQ